MAGEIESRPPNNGMFAQLADLIDQNFRGRWVSVFLLMLGTVAVLLYSLRQ
jgi:hypothetical protein